VRLKLGLATDVGVTPGLGPDAAVEPGLPPDVRLELGLATDVGVTLGLELDEAVTLGLPPDARVALGLGADVVVGLELGLGVALGLGVGAAAVTSVATRRVRAVGVNVLVIVAVVPGPEIWSLTMLYHCLLARALISGMIFLPRSVFRFGYITLAGSLRSDAHVVVPTTSSIWISPYQDGYAGMSSIRALTVLTPSSRPWMNSVTIGWMSAVMSALDRPSTKATRVS